MGNLSKFDIEDTEIRIIGEDSFMMEEPKQKPRPKYEQGFIGISEHKGCSLTWGVLLLIILLLVIVILLIFMRKQKRSGDSYVCIDASGPEAYYADVVKTNAPSDDVDVYTLVEQQTVDDIPIRLLVPTGGCAEVTVGDLDTDDASIVLAARAADYRADNGKIAGAFVYRGELLSRGHPKLGFCAIIGREVTMGMSPETPLFERAVEQSGYFFRQFSLVHDGKLGENTPPGKSIRRALCYDGSRLFVADTEERESFHDFAQALIDIGVKEALSLVGSIPLPLYEDEQGNRIVRELPHLDDVTETYIVWRR